MLKTKMNGNIKNYKMTMATMMLLDMPLIMLLLVSNLFVRYVIVLTRW